MAYLTRRPSGWRFQIRIPKHLKNLHGSTPIRINLGLISSRDARRKAVACADEVFRGFESGMSREAIQKRLQNLEADLLDLKRRKRRAGWKASNARMDYEDIVHNVVPNKKMEMFFRTEEAKEITRKEAFEDAIKRLQEQQAWLEEHISHLEPEEKDAATKQMEELSSQVAILSGQLLQASQPKPKTPDLSSLIEDWLILREGQGIDIKNVKEQGSRIRDFITFAGDRPLEDFGFLDFQRFANLLARVPSNWNKLPLFRSGTLQEAAEKNDALPPKRRHDTLSKTTIESKYLSPLRKLFMVQCAHHDLRNPFSDAKVQTPKTATEPIERSPFTIEELNSWFAAAAVESRPDMKFIPIMATLTGARVGELVFLQGKDVFELEPGLWVADLTKSIVNEVGEEQKRKLKNNSSRRLFALHDALIEVGFVEYAANRSENDWVFPHAHGIGKRALKNPAGAASKRLNRQLKRVGIHQTLEVTFHSSRHTAKDIFRDGGLDRRVHDLQTGHSLQTPSDKYGRKKLRAMDAQLISSLPLPDGLDLTPYIKARSSKPKGRQSS